MDTVEMSKEVKFTFKPLGCHNPGQPQMETPTAARKPRSEVWRPEDRGEEEIVTVTTLGAQVLCHGGSLGSVLARRHSTYMDGPEDRMSDKWSGEGPPM